MPGTTFLKWCYRFFKNPIDVYSAINPLFCVCSIFGLAPYHLVRLENGKRTFKFAWLPFCRNIVLVLLLLGSLVYHAVFDLEIFCSLLSCCAIVFGCVFALKIIEVFKNIEEVDVSFRSLAVWIPYKELYMGVIIHLVLLLLIVVALLLDFTFIELYSHSGLSLYSIFITFITIILPYFINLLMELQYGHFLNILRVRYKLLNEYLETLVQETKTLTVAKGWVEDIAIISSSNKKQRRNSDRFGSNKIPKSMMAISDPVFIVDQVAALHIKLTDTAHMINFAFCVQQLLRITVAFISIVTALFLVAINFNKSTSQKSGDQSELDYYFTFWAFSNACEVMGIVWITSETCEEANTCPRILHKIRNNTTNTNLQDTIEIYSLQMYHNRLHFTVCGLFPLDYTLLYTIVAGVTTYLVILIQFNNGDFVKHNGTNFLNATNFS